MEHGGPRYQTRQHFGGWSSKSRKRIELLMACGTKLVAPKLHSGQELSGLMIHKIFKSKAIYVRPSNDLPCKLDSTDSEDSVIELDEDSNRQCRHSSSEVRWWTYSLETYKANSLGLDTILHDQWAETLKHFFKAHQKTEKALDKRGTEVTRKLAQASLDQLKQLKEMGVVKSGPEDSDEARSHGPVRKASETPSSAPTTVQTVESPRPTEYVRSTPRKRGKRGARFKGKDEGMTYWGCDLRLGTAQLARGHVPKISARSLRRVLLRANVQCWQ
ncbi:hypothetical protein DPEC_G00188120 [Dallia pectoralis]|uniref:Uncharacterized protein n=1 Tax=Dallia pectoralis TaxID=75939 RepID=A0ACC2GBT0_DALPE|nr:hypothetical protein DPEC_G00188120 [Dallia pectoralis]